MNYLKNLFLQNFSDKEIHRTIFLESIIRKMDIGIHDYEIGHPQRIEFDIYVAVKNDNKIIGDTIEDVMDYEYLIEAHIFVCDMAQFFNTKMDNRNQ